jgi:N,N-dimethylformamidase beta subunit-like protein/concanavalin A-like lectin/glucanase superfamily protein
MGLLARCCFLVLLSGRVCTASDGPPLPKAIDVPGVHSYAQKTIAAGDMIQFRTSATVPYELSICRLGPMIDDPADDEVLKTFAIAEPTPQPIHPGSFVHVEKGLPAEEPLAALSLEVWVRPWAVKGWQTLISQHNYPTACGYGLFLNEQGSAQFYLGDGGDYRAEWTLTGPKLEARRWQHVVGTWDGKVKRLWIDGKLVGEQPFEGPARPGTAPLWLGACGHDGPAVNLLEGDLAMPVVYDRALSPEEVQARFQQQGLQPAAGDGLLACWPLDEERGDVVADVSSHARHGRIVNSGTWMIGGPSFDGSKVPRYSDYDPAEDTRRGHGLRLASDDYYDCRWKVTEEYRIPETARPGLYVGRFRFEIGGVPRLYHVTFVVKKRPDASKAPILVIASTNSWLAYQATPFAPQPPGSLYHWGTGGIANGPGNPPAYCMYRNHGAGQPAYKSGVNMPWPNAGPYVLYAQGGSGYSHLARAERFALVWLEKNGYEYDMVGDLDVHRDPGLLDGYQVVMINGHGEYWSREAYEHVDHYLCGGGNVMVLSGNVMLWRVSYNEDHSIMECRKLDAGIGGRAGCTVGEIWHSQDGRRGSQMRECGIPAWKLIGLDTFGWASIGPNDFGLYHVETPDHFLFHKPEQVGLAKGETFGGAPGGGLPMAVGHECDVRVSLLREVTADVPTGAELPEEPGGMVTLANGVLPAYAGLDYFTRKVPLKNATVAHMLYWERPQGGRVFHAGSLGSGWGLSVDPKMQTLVANVLHHFGVLVPVEQP